MHAGGVAVDWNDDIVEGEEESNSDQLDMSGSEEDLKGQRGAGYPQTEDGMPFIHYSSQDDSNAQYDHIW